MSPFRAPLILVAALAAWPVDAVWAAQPAPETDEAPADEAPADEPPPPEDAPPEDEAPPPEDLPAADEPPPEEPPIEEGLDEEVTVDLEVDRSSVEGLLLDRRRSAASGDAVGRAEITKANDRTAADAAKRVVGATIEGSRFLYVRGLGERYTNALLDGLPLPSPEPDRQAVPLDLFPSQILESLTIVKTFTPDVPGDFAGGSIRVETRRIPAELTLAGSLSLGFNTNATFAEVLGAPGGGTDWLGFDDGTRDLPAEIPGYQIGRGLTRPDGAFITPEERTQYAQALGSAMSASPFTGFPQHGGNLVASQRWELGDDARLGALASVSYDRRLEVVQGGIVRDYRRDVGGSAPLVALNDYTVDRGVDKVSAGALASVSLELGRAHRFTLTGIHTQVADDEAAIFTGRNEERGQTIHNTRLRYVARGLTFGQLRGEHELEELDGLRVRWSGALARALRDEPDTRGTVLKLDSDVGWIHEDDSYSGIHLYSSQQEVTYAGQLDLTLPLGTEARKVDVQWGGAVTARRRAFEARRLRLVPGTTPVETRYCGGIDPASCPDQLFSDANRGEVFTVEEYNREGDLYDADLDVYAAYAMLDTALTDQVRLVVGPRLEVSSQELVARQRYVDDYRAESSIDDPLVLPALSVVYTPDPALSLRASASRTVARPQVRELAPFNFTDYFGGREIQGNPDLTNTRIVNLDLRTEFFPTPAEVVAVSVFYKRFADPIEQVVVPTSGAGRLSYINAPDGDLVGVELEGRKSLGMFAPALAPLSFVGNLTLARSRIAFEPGQEGTEALTSRSRPLALQAPYAINLGLDLDLPEPRTRARLSYNVSGPRLAVVGVQGIPDIYLDPVHGLDLTVGQGIGEHLELRASAQNLLDWPIRASHDTATGDFVVSEQRRGQTFSIGLAVTN